jgi:hypothetical protein
MIFGYPEAQHERRHGPAGYAAYESYRPWLRDEFDFRCFYCLKRETWGQVTSEFELDHFQPQALNPQLRLDYRNLVYACRRCNAVKGGQAVADPFGLLHATCIVEFPDGTVRSSDSNTLRLIRQLDLNSPKLIQWRVMWMRIVELAKDRDAKLYDQLIGFPADLPDLRKLRPPQNTRQDGIEQSWFARRQRGFLPNEY